MNCPSRYKRSVMRFQCKECKRYYALVPPFYYTQPILKYLKQVITDGIENLLKWVRRLKRYGIRDCTRKMATTDLKILPG